MEQTKINSGMKSFLLIWIGQIFSLTGSAITNFGLGIWAWQKTGQATPLAMVSFFFMVPMIVMTPFAGVWVDRWNRKFVMAISDMLAGLGTGIILVLLTLGHLEIWHLYLAAVLNGIGAAFQWPAYSAAISLLVPKHQYTRANGMISLAESATGILAPVLGALLISTIGLANILMIDLVTLGIALTFLLVVKIPGVKRIVEEPGKKQSFWQELGFGFRFILTRKPLLYLQLGFFFSNLIGGVANPLFTPIILSKTNNDTVLLGSIQSVAAIGGVLGGLALTAWGGFKRKTTTVVLGWSVFGVFTALFGLARVPWLWMASLFMFTFVMPFVNGANQAIWMSKVDPSMQGRVFSIRRLVAQVSVPLALLVSGPLADKVFEPAFKTGGNWLANLFSPLVGLGAGSGMAAILFIAGNVGISVGVIGWMNPLIRDAETLLPDHDSVEAVPVELETMS